MKSQLLKISLNVYYLLQSYSESNSCSNEFKHIYYFLFYQIQDAQLYLDVFVTFVLYFYAG